MLVCQMDRLRMEAKSERQKRARQWTAISMDPNALSSIGKFSRPLWPPVQDNNPPKDKKLRLLSSITMKKRRPATSIPPTEYPVRLHYCLLHRLDSPAHHQMLVCQMDRLRMEAKSERQKRARQWTAISMDPNALSSIGKFSRPLWPPVQDNNPPKDKKLRLLSSITMKKRRPATSIPPTDGWRRREDQGHECQGPQHGGKGRNRRV
ncbi:hypothetical protein DPEC_G00368030 [Dallia pectoralis]|nr:hypothetical protein DPEC_G00368030 [Dallia pectoralis]